MVPTPLALTSSARSAPIAALVAVLLLLDLDAAAETYFDARVVAVLDGDTIDVVVDDRRLRIRLAGIDTPERGQPWAERSKQALTGRVDEKQVRINAVTVDRYGRTIGEVYADDVCVGCELVREGHAWVYRRFSDDPVLLELEAEARTARRGLWSLREADRMPPWEWRARHAGRKPRAQDSTIPDAAPRPEGCGAKATCKEMASCEEARFYLEQCGRTRLDGDGDGTPCERLCRN